MVHLFRLTEQAEEALCVVLMQWEKEATDVSLLVAVQWAQASAQREDLLDVSEADDVEGKAHGEGEAPEETHGGRPR